MDTKDAARRVEAYITNVELALEKLRGKVGEPYTRLLALAEAYASDARYYLEKGDVFTALACIAYAEGLIDSLRHLGVVEVDWEPLSKLLERPRVLVAGTFDILHPGHVYLLREAWKRGRVYVVVARDSTAARFRGRPPVVPESQRVSVISALRYVHQAILGDEDDMLKPVEVVKPHLILLGPDQWPDERRLEEELHKRGIGARVERLSARLECPLCSSTAIACRAKRLMPEEACKRG
ncbi:cytidyltransferase-related domain protein [Pyrolobus fumarii 1A]|uniref:Cytidyltransferase-related domain protein n=1 Tax=Pyrolobus fumarii (strain DSM 11204 / 1A) TaxID=694429 RepID=G0EDP7_PYRF1|nr:DUF357 domain-containing protein [Pyrolobus fumarii]AEM37884.1 cytidyltransferase-related domain protein [Pyrolobus fumarii 1A]